MPDAFTYDFYECQGCCLGYAVEADEIDEPACPSCQETDARFVKSVEISIGKLTNSEGEVSQRMDEQRIREIVREELAKEREAVAKATAEEVANEVLRKLGSQLKNSSVSHDIQSTL